jgi:hypothetical protein
MLIYGIESHVKDFFEVGDKICPWISLQILLQTIQHFVKLIATQQLFQL